METIERKPSVKSIVEIRHVSDILTQYFGEYFFINYWSSCDKWDICCFNWEVWNNTEFHEIYAQIVESLEYSKTLVSYKSKLGALWDEGIWRQKRIPFIPIKVK
jgi:hypothetical protein